MATDEELLYASGRGDREAFAHLVERHHRAMIQFIYRFLATTDRAAAEDLAQEVFLNAWSYAPTFVSRAKVRTWLFRIARNACLNYLRHLKSRPAIVSLEDVGEGEVVGSRGGGETDSVRHERGRRVRRGIAELPASQRAAIVLRHFHDLSYAEIADIIGTSSSAVDALLHRARRSLQRRLSSDDDEDSAQVLSQ